jgi:putative membrane protein (TIGR04086 family)
MPEPVMDDNEIECPNCGSTFFYQLTRCPYCGRSVYPLDDAEEPMNPYEEIGTLDTFGKILNSVAVVFLGLFVTSLVTLIPYFFIQQFVSPVALMEMQILIFSITILGAFVGGFVAARFSKHRASFHGLLVGFLSVGLALLLTAYEIDINNMYKFPPIYVPIVGWGLVTLAGLVGAEVAVRWAQKAALEGLFSPKKNEEALYRELLLKVKNDQQVAKRLIDYELQHAPNASDTYLIQSAINRWERDNQSSDLL